MINSDLYERKMSTEIKTSVLIFLLRANFVDAHAGLPFAETKKPAEGGLLLTVKPERNSWELPW